MPGIDRATAIRHHLRYNLVPSQPEELVPFVVEALEAIEAGEPDRALELPGLAVTARELVDDLRLWDMVRQPPRLRLVREEEP